MSRRISLTFDNGPTPGATEAILDVLADAHVRATFFVVGEELAKPGRRELAEQAQARGHWIGNHTMSHGAPLGVNGERARVASEIGDTQALLGSLAHADKLFRPNGEGSLGPHLLSAAAVEYLCANGFTVVTWNNVPGDWIEPRRDWVERALTTARTQDWSVVVLHDFLIGDMPDTLGRFLNAARDEGFTFTQTFPEACTPIVRGRKTDALAGVSSPARSAP